jgi:hypothetical protein
MQRARMKCHSFPFISSGVDRRPPAERRAFFEQSGPGGCSIPVRRSARVPGRSAPLFATSGCLLGLLASACGSTAARPEAPAAFFPPGTFEEAPGDDNEFVVSWYSKGLRALREPSLAARARNQRAHSYRFLWLRSFDPPIAVRLDISPDGGGTLTVKATGGKGGFDIGTLVTNRRRVMSRAEVRRFLSALAPARFWQLPTEEPAIIEHADGSITIHADGAQWILEGVKAGRYHVVDRWSPKHGAFREAALWLLRRARLRIPPDRVY